MPQYRREFFELAVAQADELGIELVIMHGEPPPELAGRNDSFVSDRFVPIASRRLPLQIGGMVWKDGREIAAAGPWDALILEQAVRNIESYRFFLRRPDRLAFWGHGRTYTKPVSRLQERIKEELTKRTDWFFAYTDGGGAAVEALGFDRSRITVVNNTIDTHGLREAVESVTAEAIQRVRTELSADAHIATFIGGLDSSKRPDFLLKTAEILNARGAPVTIVVAGSGDLRAEIGARASHLPNVRLHDPVFGEEKAALLRSSDLILMPGRVGLVAVDSFATGTPIVTTTWPWHAPEFEYLRPGVDSLVAGDDPELYADQILLGLEPANLARLSEAAWDRQPEYSVGAMVDNFTEGLALMLNTTRRRNR